jgi:MFS family permease
VGGWRLIFLVNVPAGLLGAVAARLLVPRSRPVAAAPAVEDEPRRSPIGQRQRSARWSAPVQLNLAASMLSYLLLFGTMLVVPFFLERARSFSPGRSGLLLTCLPLALGLTAPLAGHLAEHRAPAGTGAGAGDRRQRLLTAGGMTVASAALVVAALCRPTATWQLAVLLACIGAGIGAFTPANNAAVMRAASPAAAGTASGTLNRTRAVGTALGLATASIVFGLFTNVTSGFSAAALCLAGAGALAAGLSQRVATPVPRP